MQIGGSANPESERKNVLNFGAAEASNSMDQTPIITTIKSEEDSNLHSLGTKTIGVVNRIIPAEESVRFSDKDQFNKKRANVGNEQQSHQKQNRRPGTYLLIPENTKLMPFAESENPSQHAKEKTDGRASIDKESKSSESNTAMDQHPKEVTDGVGTGERGKPIKVKSLSFLDGPSPTCIDNANVHFGTPTNQKERSLKIPSPDRLRGHASLKSKGRSKRSQAPAYPVVNITDYGSDNEIGADLLEAVSVHFETHEKKRSLKSSLRNTKSQESRSITDPRERRAKRDSATQNLSVSAQGNAERASARARVSFDLPENSDLNDSVHPPKPKCHTPFPKDTIALLAGSDSEDSDGVPLECRATVPLSGGSSKSVEDAKVIDSYWVESQRPPQKTAASWMPGWKGERKKCSGAQVPSPSKKASFPGNLPVSNSTYNALPSLKKLAQPYIFVRIGRPRNMLTFERATETLNISPGPSYPERPEPVLGSYCCTCGQNVSHL
ncbi:unnamed protein product [Agarophyton chilense]|eukprot:gb/GEZJ01001582.1/.p1 GENE.gb/GEZJ01001582.1/~~gb/GEZJ01001582.1/.p1  ORF type:complete len:496 (+),score=57.58 gb/GEZJ01001582.1/:905-2392(+)